MTTWTNESDQSTTWADAHDRVTNLLPYSYDFNSWTKTQISVSNNYANSPFGDDGLASLVGDISTNVLGNIAQSLSGMTENVYRCFSVYIKKDEDTSRVADIRMIYADAAFARIRINTVTGEHSANRSIVSVANTDYGVIDDGDFWRAWVMSKHSNLLSVVRIYPAITTEISNSVVNNIATTGSVVLYGAQLEEGTSPTGLIVTNGSTITDRKQSDWARQ